MAKVFRVEDPYGWGMYSNIWYGCGLPNDSCHPIVTADSQYQQDLKAKGHHMTNYEPAGHRFGFADLAMLRRWIYNDAWLVKLGESGGVLCVYEVEDEFTVVGNTQVTFAYDRAVCLSRDPIASILN